MNKVVILGGEGNGGVVAACIEDMRCNYGREDIQVLGFLNDMETKGSLINGFPVLGNTNEWRELVSDNEVRFMFAIHPVGHGSLRVKLFDSLGIPDSLLYTLIHPSAFVSYNAIIEPGVMVMSNSYIGPAAKLGKCVLCMSNTVIGHNTALGPYCHVSVGAVVSSYVSIGTATDVALNATIKEKMNIGNYAVVGAAAMITKPVLDNEVVVGNPQRVLRLAEDKQYYTI